MFIQNKILYSERSQWMFLHTKNHDNWVKKIEILLLNKQTFRIQQVLSLTILKIDAKCLIYFASLKQKCDVPMGGTVRKN